MKKSAAPQILTESDIAVMADAAGISLSGERLTAVTDLANRFRGSVDTLRTYLADGRKTDEAKTP